MSLKANLKPYMFALGLIFSLFYSSNNAFANYQVDYYKYIANDLTLKISYPSIYQNYDKIIFSTSDLGNFNLFYQGGYGLTDLDSISSNCGDYSSYFGSSFLTTYCISVGENITFTFPSMYFYGIGMRYSNPVTKTWIDSLRGTDYLEGFISPVSNFPFSYYFNSSNNTSTSIDSTNDVQIDSFPYQGAFPVNGTCGTDNNNDVTEEPTGTGACLSGTITDMLLSSNYLSSFYSWFCFGENGGTNDLCYSPMVGTINGTCGTSDGETSEYAPTEATMCATGFSGNSLSTTINGWTWLCFGNNSGTTDSCSSINSGQIILPTNPEEDCDSYSGIDKVLCNLSNTIQGIFLPSQTKLDELQTTMNKVGNVFPFNYLRIIGTIFSGINITSGNLTMTMMGNTASLPSEFFNIPFIAEIRKGFTIMVYIAFIVWAIGYIKHFFK